MAHLVRNPFRVSNPQAIQIRAPSQPTTQNNSMPISDPAKDPRKAPPSSTMPTSFPEKTKDPRPRPTARIYLPTPAPSKSSEFGSSQPQSVSSSPPKPGGAGQLQSTSISARQGVVSIPVKDPRARPGPTTPTPESSPSSKVNRVPALQSPIVPSQNAPRPILLGGIRPAPSSGSATSTLSERITSSSVTPPPKMPLSTAPSIVAAPFSTPSPATPMTTETIVNKHIVKPMLPPSDPNRKSKVLMTNKSTLASEGIKSTEPMMPSLPKEAALPEDSMDVVVEQPVMPAPPRLKSPIVFKGKPGLYVTKQRPSTSPLKPARVISGQVIKSSPLANTLTSADGLGRYVSAPVKSLSSSDLVPPPLSQPREQSYPKACGCTENGGNLCITCRILEKADQFCKLVDAKYSEMQGGC